MNALLICRDALEDSVLGNLALAQAIGRGGGQATVIFAGEALAALDTGTFSWSENFKTRDARGAIIRHAEEAGLPLADKSRDPRWSDVRSLARSLSGEPGIRLVACPLWSKLLGLTEPPEYLDRVNETELLNLLSSAKTVVGGY